MTCIQRALIGLLGIGIAYLSYILCRREPKFSAPLLGIITLSTVLLTITVVDPETIKYGDFSILAKKLTHIEKNLRPFAVMEYPSGKLIFSSFPKDELTIKLPQRQMDLFAFSFVNEPKFVEVRSSNGGALRTVRLDKPGWVYEATFSTANTDKQGNILDKVIIEAYFEDPSTVK